MANKKAVDYVKAMISKGYKPESIRQSMLKYGYSNKDFNEAFNSAYNPTVRHELHFSVSAVIIILLIASAFVAAAFIYKSSQKAKTSLLDLNLEPVQTSVGPGENIVFLKELVNLGSKERYDVVVRQELIDQKTNVLTEKTETRAIETFGSTQTRLLVPDDIKTGNYILRVTVEYEDNKKAIATLPVKILAKNTLPENKTIACNDYEKCTEDILSEGRCIFKPITPCCGNSICEEDEECTRDCKTNDNIQAPANLDEIKDIAKSDPKKAEDECKKIGLPDLRDGCFANIGFVQKNEDYCSKVQSLRIKDICLQNIAKSKNDNSLCQKISNEGIRDSCYINFAIPPNKDFTVCDKISNIYMKQSCDSLRQLNELNTEQQETS